MCHLWDECGGFDRRQIRRLRRMEFTLQRVQAGGSEEDFLNNLKVELHTTAVRTGGNVLQLRQSLIGEFCRQCIRFEGD